MKSYNTVIFDFDYTLADSSSGIVKCFNLALNEMNYPEVKSETIKSTIGLPLAEAFIRITNPKNPDKSEVFNKYFKAFADENMERLTFFIPEAKELIVDLGRRQIKMAIVSTKYRYRIENILLREKINDLIPVIIGGEDVQEHKPNPEGLLLAIKKLNTKLENVLYVGDSEVDAETAMNAKVPFIAVLSGVTAKDKFNKYPFERIINNLGEFRQ
jgi:phosphoglycolate phosphatase